MSRIRACRCVPCIAMAMTMILGGCSSSPPKTPISVSLSSGASAALDQGLSTAITASVDNDPSAQGVTWSLSGPGSLSATAGLYVTYSAPKTGVTAAEQAIVTATSVADSTKSASLKVTVNPYPLFSAAETLPIGTVGTPYSGTIALTGGTAPFQWSIYNGPIGTGSKVGGSLPDGLSLDPGTGAISGTPTAAGTWYFEADVTDATGTNGVEVPSIQINPGTAARANPVPLLNQPLVPAAVAPGGPAFTLTVSGTGFVSGATVDLNGTPLATTFVDGEHLTAAVPATSVAGPETASVSVVNPAPGGGSSNVVYLPVAAPESTVAFSPAASSPLANHAALGITAADFNGDGKPDLAVAGSIFVNLWLGEGDGTFTAASGSPFKLDSPPYNSGTTPGGGAIVSGDLNHSGHLGLVVLDTENNAADVLLGNGDGTFSPSSAGFAFAPSGGSVTAADFNADGNLDLGLSTFVALGYGAGAFTTAGTLDNFGPSNSSIAVGDFNGDGRLDAAGGVPVSLGNGDGTFTQAGSSAVSLAQDGDPSAIVAADFNGDGRLDLALTYPGNNTVMILPGNGDGTFGAPTTIPVGDSPIAIAVGDFNADGKLDLAIANYKDNTVTLLLGNGDGTFTPASGSPYAAGTDPYALAAADFNGDGRLDLAVANSSGAVSILLQR